jgi:hypothetical protein
MMEGGKPILAVDARSSICKGLAKLALSQAIALVVL